MFKRKSVAKLVANLSEIIKYGKDYTKTDVPEWLDMQHRLCWNVFGTKVYINSKMMIGTKLVYLSE